MMKIGLQLYTVREALENDFEGTLRKAAALGYTGVEFFHYFGRTAEQVKALLEETGLQGLGAHRPYDAMVNNAEEEIAFHKTIGAPYIAVPYLTEEQRGDWAKVAENLAFVGAKTREQGITLLYHNHDFELKEHFGGRLAFDGLFEDVPADLLQVEMDTCWVHFAGYDPVAYLEKYAGRTPIIHLKDVKKRPDGTPNTVVLGEGEVDLEAVIQAAVTAGSEWAVVEQDFCERDPMESVADSLAWVRAYSKRSGNIDI